MDLTSIIRKNVFPVYKHSPTQTYGPLLEAIGDAEVVMIGEASHGTHEFYQQRAEITKQLITKKGFTFIAVEADWPDAYRVNRYVQGGKASDVTARDALQDFKRFPMWMWRNTVVLDFVEWLKQYNTSKELKDKIAFYGMDLYSFYSSMDAVIEYLEKVSPEDAEVARKRYGNFDRFQGEPAAYGYASGFGLSPSFEREVVATLVDLQKKEEIYLKGVGGLIDGDELFYTQQNAALVRNAEEYYRKMYHANDETWNLRDQHMFNCVSSLFEFHQKKFQNQRKEKVVLWAHNSHLGDARATDAGRLRGEWNVGQLMRENYGLQKTFNIGFSTYTGCVTAAKNWDKPAQCDRVRNGLYDSYEHIFHSATEGWDTKDYMMIFRNNQPNGRVSDELVDNLMRSRYERYIGVIYRPDTEKASHYCRSCLPREFDSVIFIDKTSAVEPLDRTKPWEQQYADIMEVDDADDFPELDGVIPHDQDNIDWRLRAAARINNFGIECMKNKRYYLAAMKFDKALHYIEYDLQRYSDRPNLQDLRTEVLLNRADAYYQQGGWSAVIRDCTSVLNQKPDHVQAHLLIAKAYQEKGQSRLARHHYDRASQKTAEQPHPIQNMGLDYRKMFG